MSENYSQSSRELAAFYRDEFLKHKNRLRVQKAFYTDKAFDEMESALDKIIEEIDRICHVDRFNELASQLLERIDTVTNLSGSPASLSHRIH